MTVKLITHPDTGRAVALGRKRPTLSHDEIKARSIDFSAFLRVAKLAAPPASIHYGSAATPGMSNALGNLTIGNCTTAEAGHTKDVWRANGNGLPPVTEGGALTVYREVSNWIPGQPSTDNGADEITVMEYLKTKGWTGSGKPGDTILGYAVVNTEDIVECKTAIYYFENLSLCGELPDAWLSPPPSGNGFLFDVAGAPDPENGHCMGSFGYDADAFDDATWGFYGGITPAAVAKYFVPAVNGAVYTMLSLESLVRATARAANGMTVAQMTAALGLV